MVQKVTENSKGRRTLLKGINHFERWKWISRETGSLKYNFFSAQ